jgi:hypothetical protein
MYIQSFLKFNMLPAKEFSPGTNFVTRATGDPCVHLQHHSEPILYETRDILVALKNLMHISCPSCGVRNTLFHSMKTASI